MATGKGELPTLYPVAGFQLGTASAGIKTAGRDDLVIMALAEHSTVAGVFTRNAFCAAPVQIARQHISQSASRYWLVNTGNANAGTGQQGLLDARQSCQRLAELTGVSETQVLPFSTGVIGEPLPMETLLAALPAALDNLSAEGWQRAASGIMTTDTRPKAASKQFEFDGQTFTVTGIAKGAGMIKPNMATMLGYVATDATVEQGVLQTLLNQAVNASFNRITVDGDTSTNDACMLVATGQTGKPIRAVDDAAYQALADAVCEVCIELAQGLVRDGEGASKFVSVIVEEAKTEQEALQVAYTVAESPLVKTALFASDPNWGRLLAAIGRAGIEGLDVDKVSLSLNNVLIAEQGCRAASYTEQQGVAAMAAEDINIVIKLARGEQQVTVWTSDLSHDYVRINAEYRT